MAGKMDYSQNGGDPAYRAKTLERRHAAMIASVIRSLADDDSEDGEMDSMPHEAAEGEYPDGLYGGQVPRVAPKPKKPGREMRGGGHYNKVDW